MTYVLLLLFLFYAIIVLKTLRHILYYVHEPARALSWILIVLFVPVFGLLLFRLIGRSVKQDEIFQRYLPMGRNHETINTSYLPVKHLRLVELLHKNELSFLSYQNDVQIIDSGILALRSILKDFEKARETIFLDFYIIEEGSFFEECCNIFQKKVAEGVEVAIIFDGYGTRKSKRHLLKLLTSIGVKVYEFVPFEWLRLFSYLNYRNHRKLICIDGAIAYTGGMNVSDNYIKEHKDLGLWKDTVIRIFGPAALDMERVFYRDYFNAGGAKLQNRKEVNVTPGKIPVQVISSGPDSEYRGIMQAYFVLITDAEDYVYISSPYFIPGESILTALKTSALSGIDVRLMFPYKSDSKWLRWCMYTYLEDLLKAGVKVYLYKGAFLHSKVVVSDDMLASVGTANMDMRSFETNFEINAMLYDEQTSKDLKQRFLNDISFCETLDAKTFGNRTDRNRLMESIARLSSPML
jgi:cardiolipin synthase